MTTQGPYPLPPTTLLSTTPIPQSAANDFLTAYLDRAAADPALQPNAGISEHGPVSRTTASAPNLILHNLKRVQAGLAGEVLGRDLSMVRMDEGNEGATVAEQGQEQQQEQEQEQGAGEDAGEGQIDMDVDDGQEGGVDKEERKRKKKERRLAEKKAKSKGEEA